MKNMKNKKALLLHQAFKLFILGYKIKLAKDFLNVMTNRRLQKNQPLSDKRLIFVNNIHSKYLVQWDKYEEQFEKIKSMI